ncbi:hypothetical protein POX_e06217 [Penicillium oxalicum]|uniref:Uncharacterized protein n=1 Tax=Penicillium oxalicum (strain 114-2 / CGMCC 5302) TaxID=933388 RepID=S8AZ23_PENO1|nr:hypothetical protein POX_e06217 [Penicillium oxalicum]EPS27242.1 hypothetical protein PDE_02185 [Penicillium oxalicum 114-2]KAI2788204.1 hypothetical protein POX_e06217 [Penicillium oxalicum]
MLGGAERLGFRRSKKVNGAAEFNSQVRQKHVRLDLSAGVPLTAAPESAEMPRQPYGPRTRDWPARDQQTRDLVAGDSLDTSLQVGWREDESGLAECLNCISEWATGTTDITQAGHIIPPHTSNGTKQW